MNNSAAICWLEAYIQPCLSSSGIFKGYKPCTLFLSINNFFILEKQMKVIFI